MPPRPSRDIPSAAKFWGCRQHTIVTRTEKESGRRYPANVTRQMQGEPDADGEVALCWPVAEFSVKAVLDRWGPGRYTVDWLDARRKRLESYKFTAEAPRSGAAAAAAAAAAADASEEDEEVGAMLGRLPKTQIEWLIYQQRREEASARRRREEEDAAERRRREEAREERERLRQESEDRAARDREFIASITANLTAGRAAGAVAVAPQVDLRRELEYMRRELTLAQRETAIALRNDVLANLPAGDGPETFAEALDGAGVGLVEGVGVQVPELVGEALTAFRGWLKAKGQKPDAQTMAGLVDAVRAVLVAEAQAGGVDDAGDDAANGAVNGSGGHAAPNA